MNKSISMQAKVKWLQALHYGAEGPKFSSLLCHPGTEWAPSFIFDVLWLCPRHGEITRLLETFTSMLL